MTKNRYSLDLETLRYLVEGLITDSKVSFNSFLMAGPLAKAYTWP